MSNINLELDEELLKMSSNKDIDYSLDKKIKFDDLGTMHIKIRDNDGKLVDSYSYRKVNASEPVPKYDSDEYLDTLRQKNKKYKTIFYFIIGSLIYSVIACIVSVVM